MVHYPTALLQTILHWYGYSAIPLPKAHCAAILPAKVHQALMVALNAV